MSFCLICGDPILASTDNDNDRSSKVTFVVRILLELGESFDNHLSNNEAIDWWKVCEKCEGLIEECFKVYRHLVELCEEFKRKQVDFLDKFKKSSSGNNKREDVIDSKPPSNEDTRWDDVGRKFRHLVENRDWKTHNFILQHLQSFYNFNEEITVKEELYSNYEEEVDWQQNEGVSDNSAQESLFSDGDERDYDSEETKSEEENSECPIQSNVNFDETLVKVKEEVDHEGRGETECLRDISEEIQGPSFIQENEDINCVPELEEAPSKRGTKRRLPSRDKYDSAVKKIRGKTPLVLPNIEMDPVTGMFHCPSCDYSSSWKYSARNHFRARHTGLTKLKRKSVPKFVRNLTTNDFHCTSCDFRDSSRPNVNKHYRETHLEDQQLICPRPGCGRSLKSKDSYNAHIDRHNGKPRVKCSLCPQEFYTRTQLGRHREAEHDGGRDKQNLICEMCGRGFPYRDSLRVHVKHCLKKSTEVTCTVCEKKIRQGYLKRHMLAHQKEESKKKKETKVEKDLLVKCPTPSVVLPGHKLNPETNKYHCPSCDHSYKSLQHLRNHYKVEHLKETLYKCTWPDCDKTFKKKIHFDGHVDQHKGTPRFKCALCPAAFYTVNPLIRHRQKEHEGGQVNKQFMCDQCGKGFSNSDALSSHKHYVHSEKRKQQTVPVDCEICGKRFAKSIIPNHMKTAHGNVDPSRFQTCEFCGKSLSHQTFPAHMRNVHHQFQYSGSWTCSECNHSFPSKKSLDLHLYAKHQIGEPLATKKSDKFKWKCDVTGCRRKFMDENNYKTHMDDYHGPDKTKPGKFECRFCGRRYFWEIKLKHHEMIHENAETKPFQCEVCGKGFPTSDHLRYHLVNTHKMKMDNRRGYRHLQGQLTIPKA